MNAKVICFGEILWDCFGSVKKAGGAPMNVALHLHKQGINSKLISAVGEDENGDELVAFLQKEGLDITYIQRNPNLPTGMVEVHLDEHNEAAYTIVQPVAWDQIECTNPLSELISNADALVFGSLACRGETSKTTLLKLIAQARLKVFDMNLRPPHFSPKVLQELLLQADILKINEHELEYLTKTWELQASDIQSQLALIAMKFGCSIICFTLGDKGAMIWDRGKLHQHPGFKIQLADAVGAGDAFLAAFIAGILKQTPTNEILATACAAGALVASRPGANPDYEPEGLLQIIRSHADFPQQ